MRDELPEIVKHPFAAIALRSGEHHMRARGDHRHQDRIGGKDVKQRQGADHDIIGSEQQLRPEPAVVDHARHFVLGHLRHARGAAGVEKCRDPVGRGILEGQPIRRLAGTFHVEIFDIRGVADGVFRPDQRHDQPLDAPEIAQEIHLQHRLDGRRMFHRLGHFLRQIGFRERPHRDHHLGLGLAQDG